MKGLPGEPLEAARWGLFFDKGGWLSVAFRRWQNTGWFALALTDWEQELPFINCHAPWALWLHSFLEVRLRKQLSNDIYPLEESDLSQQVAGGKVPSHSRPALLRFAFLFSPTYSLFCSSKGCLVPSRANHLLLISLKGKIYWHEIKFGKIKLVSQHHFEFPSFIFFIWIHSDFRWSYALWTLKLFAPFTYYYTISLLYISRAFIAMAVDCSIVFLSPNVGQLGCFTFFLISLFVTFYYFLFWLYSLL